MIRLEANSEFYYEFNPDTSPFRKDAWGKYYLGSCFLKTGFHFIKYVSVCVTPSWNLFAETLSINLEKLLRFDLSQTVLIPIIEIIPIYEVEELTGIKHVDSYCLIEDYYDGVSLLELMLGRVTGLNGKPIGYAVEMYNMYLSNKVDFAKTITKEILKSMQYVHDIDVCIRYSEPLINIMFTEDGLKIRLINSFLYDILIQHTNRLGRHYHFTIHNSLSYLLAVTMAEPFCSPEINLDKHVDSRTDIYSIGILLFFILTGHLPEEVIGYQHKCKQLQLKDIKDKKLRSIIKKATEKDPSKRYQSAGDFIKAIDDKEKSRPSLWNKIKDLMLPYW